MSNERPQLAGVRICSRARLSRYCREEAGRHRPRHTIEYRSLVANRQRKDAPERGADSPATRVSVVIPLYQSHATLGGCLRAIGQQTFGKVEVILDQPGGAS